MSLSHSVGVDGDIDVKMAAAISEDHFIEFDPDNTLSPAIDLVINSSDMTFTSLNWNTNQQLNVTPKRIGSISIPYKITSSYTREEKTGHITITVT